MRIIVNHLTRLKYGNICVAGLDAETGRHIRPVIEHHRMNGAFLRRNGGPFDIGCLVDLGPTQPVGQAPECEDHRFTLHKVRPVGETTPDEFWRLLSRAARPTLRDIFGPDLQRRGAGATVDPQRGSASLGCLGGVRPVLSVDGFKGIRLSFTEPGAAEQLNLSVTDVRLAQADLQTPRQAAIDALARRIAEGVEVILAVGLGRAWQKESDTGPRHWLHVNNIHLVDDPAWKDAAR
jgi:hypothetical protein